MQKLPMHLVGRKAAVRTGGPLCRACNDQGYVRRPSGRAHTPWDTDACPDCARDAELRWQASRINLQQERAA